MVLSNENSVTDYLYLYWIESNNTKHVVSTYVKTISDKIIFIYIINFIIIKVCKSSICIHFSYYQIFLAYNVIN